MRLHGKGILNVLGLALIVVAVFLGEQALSQVRSQARTALTQQHTINVQQAQLNALVAANQAGSKAQLSNRVANVATWCGAINEGRDYSRVRSRQLRQAILYTLKDLDCKALEAGTKMSATPKTARTGATGATGPATPVTVPGSPKGGH